MKLFKKFFTILCIMLILVICVECCSANDERLDYSDLGNALDSRYAEFQISSFLQPGSSGYYYTDSGYNLNEYLCTGEIIRFPIVISDLDPKTASDASLILNVFDIDDISGEIDNVYVNGKFIGTLYGITDEWDYNTFTIDPSILIQGENWVDIDIDITGGGWCTACSFGAISLDSTFVNSTSTDWANVVPTGNITYPPGSEKIYFNQAKPGANLTNVIVNLTSQGPVDNYLFMNIQGENNITAYGEPKEGQVHAFFDASPRYGPLGLTVSFTDRSLGYPTSWYWDFGDGKNSTERYPSNTYLLPGLYTVSLRVANDISSSTGVWTNCVNVTETDIPAPDPVPTPEKIIPEFIGSPTKGSGTLLVSFQDQSTGNPTSWYWDFGDGNSSTEKYPEHLYESSGLFSVTLTASNSQYSGSLTKNSYIDLS